MMCNCLQERLVIHGALQREVMRVHRQLLMAAGQIKPLPTDAVESWDVAFSQVTASDLCNNSSNSWHYQVPERPTA